MMTTEDQIKAFLTKLATQNNRGTRAPYFYTIQYDKEEFTGPDWADDVKWVDPEIDESFETKEDFVKYLVKQGYNEDTIRTDHLLKVGVKKVFRTRGMFLTEDDAKNHLKQNHYHYPHNAHTYLDACFRAPETEQFFINLFKHFNMPTGNYTLDLNKDGSHFYENNDKNSG